MCKERWAGDAVGGWVGGGEGLVYVDVGRSITCAWSPGVAHGALYGVHLSVVADRAGGASPEAQSFRGLGKGGG